MSEGSVRASREIHDPMHRLVGSFCCVSFGDIPYDCVFSENLDTKTDPPPLQDESAGRVPFGASS